MEVSDAEWQAELSAVCLSVESVMASVEVLVLAFLTGMVVGVAFVVIELAPSLVRRLRLGPPLKP